MAPFFEAFGVAITVTRPNADPVGAVGIWLSPLEEGRPTGVDFARWGSRKVMGIAKSSSLPDLPKGTVIVAPELGASGVPLNWRVDGYESAVEPELMRVLLLPLPTKDTL
jgi:hypothetical protein